MAEEGSAIEESQVTGEGSENTSKAVTPVPETESPEGENQEKESKLEDDGEDKPVRKSQTQKRIERLERKFERQMQETLARERQNWEREAQSKQPQSMAEAPKLEQFDNFDDYVDAKAEYKSRQILEQFQEKQRQTEEQSRSERQQGELTKTWSKRVESIRAEIDDFDDVIESAGVEISSVMTQALMESDVGPKVAYYLAKNPDEAEKISEMSPSGVFRAIGRIEAKIESEVAARIKSNAPKPPSTIGGKSGAAEKDPDKMSVKEWVKWRENQLKRA